MKKLLCLVFVCIFISAAAAQNFTIQQYLNIKSANSPTFSPDGKHLAYLTNVTGTSQVWTVDLPKGSPKQLTNYDDNVSFIRWLPDGGGMVFGKAHGGDENTQFFWMKPDGTGVKALTNEPEIRYNFAQVSWDGRTIYYASNKRNRNYFDLYEMDLASGKEELIYQQDGNNDVAAVNESGTKIVVSRDGTEFSLDNNLYLYDIGTKQEILLTPHTEDAQFGNVHFIADGIIFAHNDKREFYSLAQMRKINASQDDWGLKNLETRVLDNTNWDIDAVAMVPYGNQVAYTLNREGFSELFVKKFDTGGKPLITNFDKTSGAVKLPAQGIVGGLTFDKDQSKLAFSFNSATQNGDIWIYDLNSKGLTQVTKSEGAGIEKRSFIAPRFIKYKSFDDRDISAWFYEPQGRKNVVLSPGPGRGTKPIIRSGSVPVIVSVHGGPEGQERPGFNALYQYYLSRGYAILATNVRGSTGYGKTFTHLDDVRKREDSVKDLASAVEWLKTTGGADPRRIAVMGGSYGGYMTLAAITLYPDLWAAAVDTVGIANWESFLKNTSGYRHRQREVEYGSMEKDGDFLRSISPIAKVERIKTPLFVIAGKNDPRVPYTEAEQMVGELKKRGAVVQYKLYDDEGHGIAKLKNRLELYPLVADFLDKYMK